jgi:hypothetical protein
VLSTASMVYGASFIVFRVGGGALADAVGPELAIVGLATAVAILTTSLRVFGNPVQEPTD